VESVKTTSPLRAEEKRGIVAGEDCSKAKSRGTRMGGRETVNRCQGPLQEAAKKTTRDLTTGKTRERGNPGKIKKAGGS